MKLFVDDLRNPPSDEGWTLARTNTEAIRLLATGYVEECSIDHDIVTLNAGNISEPIRKRLMIGQETFQPVVYYIIAMKPEDRPKKVTMHTANVSMGRQLVAMMQKAGIESEYQESGVMVDLSDLHESED